MDVEDDEGRGRPTSETKKQHDDDDDGSNDNHNNDPKQIMQDNDNDKNTDIGVEEEKKEEQDIVVNPNKDDVKDEKKNDKNDYDNDKDKPMNQPPHTNSHHRNPQRFPKEFYCPKIHKLFRDPVVRSNGISYERSSLLTLVENKEAEAEADEAVYPNRALVSIMEETIPYMGDSTRSQLKRMDRSIRQVFLSSKWWLLDNNNKLSSQSPPLPKGYYCPITCKVFQNPVIDPEGNTFDRTALEQWVTTHGTSPLTRTSLSMQTVYPNLVIQWLIEEERNKPLECMHPSIRNQMHNEDEENNQNTNHNTNHNTKRTTETTTTIGSTNDATGVGVSTTNTNTAHDSVWCGGTRQECSTCWKAWGFVVIAIVAFLLFGLWGLCIITITLFFLKICCADDIHDEEENNYYYNHEQDTTNTNSNTNSNNSNDDV